MMTNWRGLIRAAPGTRKSGRGTSQTHCPRSGNNGDGKFVTDDARTELEMCLRTHSLMKLSRVDKDVTTEERRATESLK